MLKFSITACHPLPSSLAEATAFSKGCGERFVPEWLRFWQRLFTVYFDLAVHTPQPGRSVAPPRPSIFVCLILMRMPYSHMCVFFVLGDMCGNIYISCLVVISTLHVWFSIGTSMMINAYMVLIAGLAHAAHVSVGNPW